MKTTNEIISPDRRKLTEIFFWLLKISFFIADTSSMIQHCSVQAEILGMGRVSPVFLSPYLTCWSRALLCCRLSPWLESLVLLPVCSSASLMPLRAWEDKKKRWVTRGRKETSGSSARSRRRQSWGTEKRVLISHRNLHMVPSALPPSTFSSASSEKALGKLFPSFINKTLVAPIWWEPSLEATCTNSLPMALKKKVTFLSGLLWYMQVQNQTKRLQIPHIEVDPPSKKFMNAVVEPPSEIVDP